MLTMAIKMTGIRPVNLKKRISGGKMVAMPRRDVLVYLFYMMTISETMTKSPERRVYYLK